MARCVGRGIWRATGTPAPNGNWIRQMGCVRRGLALIGRVVAELIGSGKSGELALDGTDGAALEQRAAFLIGRRCSKPPGPHWQTAAGEASWSWRCSAERRWFYWLQYGTLLPVQLIKAADAAAFNASPGRTWYRLALVSQTSPPVRYAYTAHRTALHARRDQSCYWIW